jgi:hypothetical protein
LQPNHGHGDNGHGVRRGVFGGGLLEKKSPQGVWVQFLRKPLFLGSNVQS